MMLERVHQIQLKWRRILVVVNWTMVFVSIIVCLLPIFLHCDGQRRGIPSGYFEDLLNNSTFTSPVDSTTVLSLMTDDYVALLGTPDINSAMIVGPFLGMCVPALFDLVVELYVTLTQPITAMHSTNGFPIVRLSMLERFCFILGVICNAFYFVIPMDWNVMVIFNVHISTTILANVLNAAPIIIFLERTTNVFSPLFTSLVLFLLTLGNVMAVQSYDLAYDTSAHIEIYYYSTKIMITCYLLVLSACFWSFLRFLYLKRTKTSLSGTKEEQHDPFLDFSKTHVPACHMVALCITLAITLYFNFATPTPEIYYLLWTLLLFASALVFAIEMRVRQNEVISGLSELEKKNYEVRL